MKVYVIEGGEVFEGTVAQFEDCFFSLHGWESADDQIKDFCEENDWKLEIRRGKK